MNLKITLGRFGIARLLLCAAVLAAGFSSCGTDEQDAGFALYYTGVQNIGPGSSSYTLAAPTYIGPAPGEFSITAVTFDGNPYEAGDHFTIDFNTGRITIGNTSSLAEGDYSISVSCVAAGKSFAFPDAVKVRISPSVPAELVYDPPVVTMSLADIALPDTAKIVSMSETVSVREYALVQEPGEAYFYINTSTGAVSLAKDSKITPGLHPVTVMVKTYAGQKVYPGIVAFNITSAPVSVKYGNDNTGVVEFNQAYQSPAPVTVGSTEGLTYAIKSVTPADGGKIAINAATGVLSVAANSSLAIEDYVVDLTVTNNFGSTDFDGAFTLSVVDFIDPISAFSYATPQNKMQGVAFTISKAAGFVGKAVTFSFVDLPAALSALTINPTNGDISAVKGNKMPVGSYTVKVHAENIKNSADATFSLVIEPNPYHFTKIGWGNNLGLTPAANYASQWTLPTSGTIAVSAPLDATMTNAPAGTEYSLLGGKINNPDNVTINSATGEISISGNPLNSVNNSGFVMVRAVAGKDTPAEVVVEMPFFYTRSVVAATAQGSVVVKYLPFVFKVNPRSGGDGPAIVLDGTYPNWMMDYRRDIFFYDFNTDPAVATSAATTGSDIAALWVQYYKDINKALATGSRDPIGFYTNLNNGTLDKALMYIDNRAGKNFALHVNPGKFVVADGSATGRAMRGVLSGSINILPGGGTTTELDNAANANRIFPILLWFDESF